MEISSCAVFWSVVVAAPMVTSVWIFLVHDFGFRGPIELTKDTIFWLRHDVGAPMVFAAFVLLAAAIGFVAAEHITLSPCHELTGAFSAAPPPSPSFTAVCDFIPR